MLKANGFRIICDLPNCGRMQDIPMRNESEARDLAQKLGWRQEGALDVCPQDVPGEMARAEGVGVRQCVT